MTRFALLVCGALSLGLAGTHAKSEEAELGRHVDRTHLWERCGEVLNGFGNMYQFDVLQEADASSFPFRAWFFGWAAADCNPGHAGCDAIFAARSQALSEGWQVWAGDGGWDEERKTASWMPVIAAREEPFDQWHNGDPSVVRVDDRYCMAYSSTGHNEDGKPFGHPEDKDGSILCVMGAVSDDGIEWERSAEPILMNPADLGAAHVSGGDSHLFGSYHRPSLLHEDGTFRLWFDYWAGTAKGVSVGYAENTGNFLDPGDWHVIQAGDTPVLRQFPNPDVVRIEDVYFAYGDPPVGDTHPWRARKITEVVSLNGLNWVVLGHVEPDENVPATHVPQAFVRLEGEQTWMYVSYACQIGGEPYDYRYDSIRLMRREVTSTELAGLRDVCGPETGVVAHR